jgi:hypothetical protein
MSTNINSNVRDINKRREHHSLTDYGLFEGRYLPRIKGVHLLKTRILLKDHRTLWVHGTLRSAPGSNRSKSSHLHEQLQCVERSSW